MDETIRFSDFRAAYMRLIVNGGLDKSFMSRRVWAAAIIDAAEARAEAWRRGVGGR